MITTAELHRVAVAQGLRFDQVEKDYVVLWLLYAFSHPEFEPQGWVFKGGTALRHCYYPGYRFSEDIDFTCAPQENTLESVQTLLNRVARWIQETSGIRITPKDPQTVPGDFQVEIAMEYSRGGLRTQGLPAVKIHLTFDEPVLTKPVSSKVNPLYSDLSGFQISVYSKPEIVAEKMRALLQQQRKWPRPRDLYDLWFILCRSRERLPQEKLKELFVEKCRVRQIAPDPKGLSSENLKEWNRKAWSNSLGPMLKTLPDYDQVWREWVTACRRIFS
jgi:predicted nucleotidyltransferase component of viral defense system